MSIVNKSNHSNMSALESVDSIRPNWNFPGSNMIHPIILKKKRSIYIANISFFVQLTEKNNIGIVCYSISNIDVILPNSLNTECRWKGSIYKYEMGCRKIVFTCRRSPRDKVLAERKWPRKRHSYCAWIYSFKRNIYILCRFFVR